MTKRHSDNPFVVGSSYRNRNGSYEVVSIADPDMVIRYTDGITLQTTVAQQARTFRNIVDEEDEAEKQRKQAALAKPVRPVRRARVTRK